MKRASFPVAAALLTISGAARAAAPPNDSIEDATPITTLPFSDTEDTTDATTGPEDDGCEGSATVWYRFTPTADQGLLLDTTGSGYQTFVSVYVVTDQGRGNLVCGALEKTILPVRAGTTYFISVSAPFGEPGGRLEFQARTSPFTLAISPKGSFDARTGAATVTATLTCAEPANLLFRDIAVTQRAGRAIFQGFDGVSLNAVCDPDHPFVTTATLSSSSGLFRGGRAEVEASFGFFFGGFSFGNLATTASVSLGGR